MNRVAFDTPAVPDGGTVRQQLRVHANDAGRLTLYLRYAENQYIRPSAPITFGNPVTGPGGDCEMRSTAVPDRDLPQAGSQVSICSLVTAPNRAAAGRKVPSRAWPMPPSPPEALLSDYGLQESGGVGNAII
ncbi:hypothetical protein [Streptomyces sp. NPDC006477]|uniref:hypothetical protein n=1 Tax=Streptomyces sp. NPDC006477 TaxID=3364747 RepID=UPI0036B91D77